MDYFNFIIWFKFELKNNSYIIQLNEICYQIIITIQTLLSYFDFRQKMMTNPGTNLFLILELPFLLLGEHGGLVNLMKS